MDPHAHKADDQHESTTQHAQVGAEQSGLLSTGGGVTLQPVQGRLRAGEPSRFAFRVLGPAGAPIRNLDVRHDRPIHLVLVRRDLAHYQHLHPRRWELVDGGCPARTRTLSRDSGLFGRRFPPHAWSRPGRARLLRTGGAPPIVETTSVDGFVVELMTGERKSDFSSPTSRGWQTRRAPRAAGPAPAPSKTAERSSDAKTSTSPLALP